MFSLATRSKEEQDEDTFLLVASNSDHFMGLLILITMLGLILNLYAILKYKFNIKVHIELNTIKGDVNIKANNDFTYGKQTL